MTSPESHAERDRSGARSLTPGTPRTTLRRALTIRFVSVALLSVLLLGGLNYWQARSLLDNGVTDRLASQQASISRAISSGLGRLQSAVSVLSDDPVTIGALSDFNAAWEDLDQSAGLSESELADLETFYADGLVAAIAEAGFDAPAVADLMPDSVAGRYLQYHYIVQNPFEADRRGEMSVADADDSGYGIVHERLHPVLSAAADRVGLGGLLLVDDRGRVVYTTAKRVDLGTSMTTGPYRDTGLAQAINVRLPASPVGETVLIDFERYLPANAAPTMFAAAAVRQDTRTIGAVVLEVPIAAVNALTTNRMAWEESGLGRTGETYVVDSDRTMRSDARLWLEDPAAYLDRLRGSDYPPELVESIEFFSTTVLLQPVDTAAVNGAFDGERFVGRSSDYLGRRTRAVAGPVASEQLEWVVVSSVTYDEASASLKTFTTRILVAAAVIIPVVALAGALLARRMTRPVGPLVEAAANVSAGDLDTQVPDLGRDEFGDLARRLNTLTKDLREKEQALAEEERQIAGLLASALPPRIVRQVRRGERRIPDLVDTATIIAMTVSGLLDEESLDAEFAVEMSVRLSQTLEGVADELGIERVRSSSTQHVFAAGLDSPDSEAGAAVEFVTRAVRAVEDLSDEIGVAVGHRVGICSGEVIASLLQADQLTYGVFGDAARVALALSSIARPGQILLCPGTGRELGDEWQVREISGVVDLRGEPLRALLLEVDRAKDDRPA